MKTENKLILISLACGLAAAALAFKLVTGKEKSILSSMEPVKVAAAAKYIPAWSKLDESMVSYIDIPGKFVTKAHITKFEKHRGQMAMAPFIEGEPLLSNKLTSRGGELNAVIPTGLRAVSVAVDEEAGVGYMIKAGDRVDVILTYHDQETPGKKKMVTATLLQDAAVVAVGRDFSLSKKSESYGSITLALTPDEAELLVFGREKGKISFTLRPLGDRTREKIKMKSFDDLVARIKSNERELPASSAKSAGEDDFEVKKRNGEQ